MRCQRHGVVARCVVDILRVGITAAASVFVYYGRGDIHPLVVIPTALGVFTGAMLGVYILPRLRVAWLRLGIIGLLIVMGVQMLLRGLHP